ncbi:Uncharacterised protein [[Clostridium] sordellii]|uniref:hypothetical protein n=1 Tax=Paraclostridium sordellii TaxID=1505 RepID=UPI0005E35DC6|nr:hypothetical protein [Paeniclostridium sordellii]CEQ01695.1 Uncharacterised protein [[Clostridium] sordellii] [Paeniclostridium sordellii]
MNKRIENLVKRVEKNNGKSVTLRRDVLVKMAQEQLFDYMDSYSYDDMFGVSESKGLKGDFTESCEDVRKSSVGFCSVRIVDNKLKFYCHIHSNSSFNLYIELNEDQKESKEIEILEDVKVELNEDKNGVEIYFSNKPSEEVRNNLKANGFRWSKYNKCWYAKQSEDTLNFANSLLPKEDTEVATTEELNNKSMEDESMNYNDKLREIFNTEDYYSIIERPINGKLCKDYSKEELFILFDENNIKYDKRAPKENLFLFLLDWIEEGDEMGLIENVTINNTEEPKNTIKYFKDTTPGNKDFKVIEGTTVTTKEIIGDEVWKINDPKDLIKDYGHRDQKAYIKHLKKFGYVEVFEDMNNFVSCYNNPGEETIITAGVKQDPQIEKWNNKLNTQDEVIKQLNSLKRYVNKRKKETPLLNCVPANGYIISKLLQLQGEKVQYNKIDFKKCYYIVSDSTPEAVKIAFKDSNNNLQYYVLYTDKITISSLQNDSLDMNLQLLANEKTYNNAIKIDCKEVLKETEDYILFKKGNIYVLRYFDECFYHEKYDRNKKITQSRITKYYDNIKHLLE